MKPETELAIEKILEQVAYCAIPISWRTTSPLPGVGYRKGVRRGPGLDFLGTALFKEGDDERHINWIATAQAEDEETVYKTVYRQQKELKAHIFVDVSPSMDFGTERTTKLMLAAEVAASAIYALDKTRDKVGATVYSRDTVIETLPTKQARMNLVPALVNIIEADPKEATKLDAKPGDGLSKALSILPAARQLVFIVSDFLNMSDNDWKELGNTAVMHDVICVFVQDVREQRLPTIAGWLGRIGCYHLIQDADGNSLWVWNSPRTRKQWEDNWRAHVARVSSHIVERHCELLDLNTGEGDLAIPKILDLFAGHN